MSEFQQYQFKTIDEPLSAKQRAFVDALSSRGEVTNTSANFVYNYSDFGGDELKLMTDYFDAMFYVANWGSMRLMFRFPKKLVDEKTLLAYQTEFESCSLTVHNKKKFLILDLSINQEGGGGWIDEEDYNLEEIISLRNQIINGDYRMLFLAWLSVEQLKVQLGAEGLEKVICPPIPPNLKKPNSALSEFMEWFETDIDLISAAAAKSQIVAENKVDYPNLLSKLDLSEKEEFLNRLISGENRLDLKLKQRLDSFLPSKPSHNITGISLLTLFKSSDKEEQKRIQKEKRAAEKAHLKKMEQLAKAETKLWTEVEFHFDQKVNSSYKKATAILADLKELATHHNKLNAFKKKLAAAQEKHHTSVALTKRLMEAGILT